MREVVAISGMSLLDVALMYNGTLETLPDIARENSLPLDYCFEKREMVLVPEEANSMIRVIADNLGGFVTGIEGKSEWEWILADGRWNDSGVWADWDWWRD